MKFSKSDPPYELTLSLTLVGEDIAAVIFGGEKPHIGSAAVAVPRPSLADPSKTSATSSVINLTGHKDEGLCRLVADELCGRSGRVTVCTGGFHNDNMTPEQIKRVVLLAGALVEDALEALREPAP